MGRFLRNNGPWAHSVIWSVLLCFLTLTVGVDADARKRRRRKKKKPKAPIATVGEATIMSVTLGAKIYINDKLIGVVPYNKPIKLKPGKHSVKLVKRGYTEYQDVFKIEAGKTNELEIDLIAYEGILIVKGTPKDAQVFLGTQYIGSPPIDKNIKIGKHTIRFKKLGFQEQVRQISIGGGKELKLNFKLVPISGWKRKVVIAPSVAKTPWYKTWWFWTITGVVLAGATTAGVVLGTQKTATTPTPNFAITPP